MNIFSSLDDSVYGLVWALCFSFHFRGDLIGGPALYPSLLLAFSVLVYVPSSKIPTGWLFSLLSCLCASYASVDIPTFSSRLEK
jgi:hypothetical protein